MTAIITMAGLGSRFRAEGYEQPKYEIVVHGRPLFDWSLVSLRELIDQRHSFVFICLKANNSRAFVTERCAKLGIRSFDIIEIDQLTDGQATTVLAARSSAYATSGALAIFNIDTHLNPRAVSRARPFAVPSVLCFPGAGDAWSFARTGPDGYAVEVTEKVRVSEHASVGLYVFSDWAQYDRAYQDTYVQPRHPVTTKERYIAPMYNALISQKICVAVPTIGAEDVVPLGTPAEVRAFAARCGVGFPDY